MKERKSANIFIMNEEIACAETATIKMKIFSRICIRHRCRCIQMGSYLTDVKPHIKETPSACERTETV